MRSSTIIRFDTGAAKDAFEAKRELDAAPFSDALGPLDVRVENESARESPSRSYTPSSYRSLHAAWIANCYTSVAERTYTKTYSAETR